jgi:hypothetical protein
VDQLAVTVASALRKHDPLDPWLTESHWDDAYWNREGERIAMRVTPEMGTAEIRAVVVDVLGDLLSGASDPNDQSRRLDRVVEEIADAIGSA